MLPHGRLKAGIPPKLHPVLSPKKAMQAACCFVLAPHKTIVWAGGVYIKGLEMYFANKHCKRYIASLFDLGLGAAYGSLKVLCCLGVVAN